MKAVSTGSGAVMFIPDDLEVKTKTQSYKDIVGGNDETQNFQRKILTRAKNIAKKLGITKAA